MISITAPMEFSALPREQQQLSPVHAYRQNTKSARSSFISDVDTVHDLKPIPELPQKDKPKLPESSWLLLTPDNSDEQIDVETAGRPGTARTSRVTIPSYYYHYYRKYFDRDSYRVKSQYYPESRLSSDLISYRDRSSRASIYQNRGTSTHHERISAHSKPLVPDKSFIDKEPSEPLTDQDPNLAYFEFDVQLPHKPKQAILPPPPARRSRRSMDTYGSHQDQSRKKKNRQTASSIATVSTAPIFRQHPGEQVDLESMGRVGRVRSSVLSGLIVR
jgi:hypothetical protein